MGVVIDDNVGISPSCTRRVHEHLVPYVGVGGSPMTGDEAGFVFKSVHTIRGTEAQTITKLQKEGWEFVTQTREPLMRTKLTFRRQKPKQPWLLWGLGAAAVLIAGLVLSSIQGGDDAPSSAVPTTVAAETPAGTPSSEPTVEQQPSAPPEGRTDTSVPEQTLTVENNEDLATLLSGTATGGEIVENFAANYKGKLIEFDANIAAMNNHGSYKTRFDILIAAGDYSTTTSKGPNFQFRDVNIVSDLHLTGSNVPNTIGKGDNLHVIAQVGEFNSSSQLFFLKPVSTTVR